ncbi:GGDEF domain-containing protein [Tahibacter amnicola]|uniref:diguanylate cyclase n=1 Tax=Tahibacter amnicola TaxID=2976241 RepID=A0ABY6BLP3_9GAMM|nr:diguanylate cyclase [Tahibacter amnicola]UXI69965.1 diguanylate cyclase [Tahibacter amnicola]
MDILVADDDPGSRNVLATLLETMGHTVATVDDGTAALAALAKGRYPLLISDWLMPGLDGLSLCRAVRAQSGAPYTYIILITAMDGPANYLDGIDAGADDFIGKPVDPKYLIARLHVAERILSLHERLRNQATHDHLTGLLNRGAILEALDQEMQRAAREGHHLGVLMVDLDHFKPVNDAHGHPVGDTVLRETARRMQSSLRPYDRIGRYGGEEFLVVVPGEPPAVITEIAERIRLAVAADAVTTAVGDIAVTVSIGVATSNGSACEAGHLVGVADDALYRAKAAGRNRVEPCAPLQPDET